MIISVKCKNSAVKRKLPSRKAREQLLSNQNNSCFYCGTAFGEWIIYKREPLLLQPNWDHVLPYSYCFNNQVENFVAACRICNLIKKDKIFDTTEEAIKYVRTRREEKRLPLFELSRKLHTEEEMAKILFREMQNRALLETSRSCEEMSTDELWAKHDELELFLKRLDRGLIKLDA